MIFTQEDITKRENSNTVFLKEEKLIGAKQLNILVRRSRQSGVARATNPDFESHRLLLILLVSDLNHILLA